MWRASKAQRHELSRAVLDLQPIQRAIVVRRVRRTALYPTLRRIVEIRLAFARTMFLLNLRPTWRTCQYGNYCTHWVCQASRIGLDAECEYCDHVAHR